MDDQHQDGGLPGFSDWLLTQPAVINAATGALMNVPPVDYLRSEEPVEQAVLEAVIEVADQQWHKKIDHLGGVIARAVWG